MKAYLMFVGACACLAACTSTGPRSGGASSGPGTAQDGASFQEPIDLFPEAIGNWSWKITTESETAQAYFDQGLQLRYAYGVDVATRSFHEAQKADPNCAMCYWGEAYALGSYLNAAITTEKAPYALAAIRRAAELAGTNATQMEKDLIEATLDRYVENYDPQMKPELDQAFADSMAGVHENYPDDLNITTIYASAIFLMEPRRGLRDIDAPGTIRLHAVLEEGLAKDITHPGLCHLYIHATESTVRPDLAEPCAEFISDGIPGASHIQHMPSHTWNEVGRWGDSVRANINAWHSDQKVAVGEGVSIYPDHNLHMLLFAASMDGQGALATQAGKDYTKITDNSMYEAMTLVRFGRFDEVLTLDNRPREEVTAALWDFAVGYANIHAGDIDVAAEIAQEILELAETAEGTFRRHPGGRLIGTVAHILDGEIERVNGNLDAAITAFQQAVIIEDQLDYDEPEPLPFAARHWLGAALLEAGRYSEADRVYRDELVDHPHNVWSLHGLKAALAAQGRQDSAVDEDFAASTARTDTWITQSRF